jgi:hypothetical protein
MLRQILSFVITWYNLPFTVMFALGILLATLQLSGAATDEETEGDLQQEAGLDQDAGHDIDGDADADLDHDVDGGDADAGDLDHEVGHDVDGDLDHELGHDVDHSAGEHDADHEAAAGAGFSILALLGAGKAPLLVVLLMLFEAIALLGWLLNAVAVTLAGHYPSPAILVVLPVALLGGGAVTARTARLIGGTLPPISTTASRAQSLVGLRGTVISPYVDEQYGMIHLRDAGGTLITVFAVVAGEAPIRRGEAVILLGYDAGQRRYRAGRPRQPATLLAGR